MNCDNEQTDAVPEIFKDFGEVFCGKKAIEHVKIRNTSKKIQSIIVAPLKADKIVYSRLRVSPQQAAASPGQPVRLTLTYTSHLEDLTDVVFYNIFECQKLVARLYVTARTLGPSLSCNTYNVKFFRFRDVNQTVRNVTLENVHKCEAKFYFDLDEDYKQIQISQTHGVLPAESKLNLKIIFNSLEPGIYYKTIFCLIQYHPPLIFNILSVCQPRLKLDPKNLNLRYPLEIRPDCNYAAYMEKLKIESAAEGEKINFLQKCAAERDCVSGTTNEEIEMENICWSGEDYDLHQQLKKEKINKASFEVFLTTFFIDIKNQPKTLRGTTLVNLSKCQRYYYEWDQGHNNNFQIQPGQGIIEPNMKTYFNIYFSPSQLDLLYHTEIDLRVFPYDSELKVSASDIIHLPLTKSLRILGNSFPDDSCGWMAQCVIVPKTLQLPSCVPEENVYATFMIERRGHLPVSFSVVPSKDANYSVQPPLGYLSRDYQLFVIEFNGKSKEEGVYSEDLKIVFNNSESTCEILKVSTSVEIPKLIFGKRNLHVFNPIFAGARTTEKITIENPTNLNLSYEFETPEDITWCEIVNPKGVIKSNCFSEVTVVFKPEVPSEYLGSLKCSVSSISRADFVQTVHLRLKGSSQFGYLVATPRIHDFGNCAYLEQKSTKIHLFNFSQVLIHFQLTAVHGDFPMSDVKQDVKITPSRGAIPKKSSLEVEVAVTPHDRGTFQYAVLCQNLVDDSEDAETCDEPRSIFSFTFQGVLSAIQITDVTLEGGSHLFSPQWLWKMLDVNKMNRILNSFDKEALIDMNFPEAVLDSPPARVNLQVKANEHGDFYGTIHKSLECPCLEATNCNFANECCHLAQMEAEPREIKLRANEQTTVQFSVSYTIAGSYSFDWIMFLPHKRSILMRAKVVTLPCCEKFAVPSMYLSPMINLKPVFIGDPDPFLQLFWLYNNSDQPAAYSVVNVTLWENNSDVERIFECINPIGVIPPVSTLPLGFFFRPNELKQYSGQISLGFNENKIEHIRIEGTGVPHIQQSTELGFEKVGPKALSLCYSETDLRISRSDVNIRFHRTFSKIKRIFFMENKSETITWSFRWHTFIIENLVHARVHPSEGRIEPGQKILMTLTLTSFSYSTTIGFSIPCDVLSYSKLKAHEEAVKLQNLMKEKAKDYFTITEKGTKYENQEIEIPEKPKVRHIFIWINANILTDKNVDTKLRPEQKGKMKAESEIETGPREDAFLKKSVLPPILQVFEQILWDILNKRDLRKKMEISKNFNFRYLQLLPESRRKRKKAYNTSQLPISYVQFLFESKLKQVISSNFIRPNKKENSC